MGFRRVFILPLVMVSALGLAGCQQGTSAPPAPGQPQRTAPQIQHDAKLVPGGSAAQNKPFFDKIFTDAVKGKPEITAALLVEALTKAGFEKASMEASPDKTPTGLDVDYHLVSVKLGVECLIGQISDDGYHSTVAKPLETGRCLFGEYKPLS